jgi:hypothetical protein
MSFRVPSLHLAILHFVFAQPEISPNGSRQGEVAALPGSHGHCTMVLRIVPGCDSAVGHSGMSASISENMATRIPLCRCPDRAAIWVGGGQTIPYFYIVCTPEPPWRWLGDFSGWAVFNFILHFYRHPFFAARKHDV